MNPTQPDRFEDHTREDETYLLEQERERLERAAEKADVFQQPGYWFAHSGPRSAGHGLGQPPSTDARAPLWSHFTRWLRGAA